MTREQAKWSVFFDTLQKLASQEHAEADTPPYPPAQIAHQSTQAASQPSDGRGTRYLKAVGAGTGYAAGHAMGSFNRYELGKAVREAHGLSNTPIDKAAGYSHEDLSSAGAPAYVTAQPTTGDKALHALSRAGRGAAIGSTLGVMSSMAAPGNLGSAAALTREAVYGGAGALIGGGLGAASSLLPSHAMTGDEYGALDPEEQTALRQGLPHQPLLGGIGGGIVGAMGGAGIGAGLGALTGQGLGGTATGMGAGALGGAVLGAGLGVHAGRQDQRELVRAIREYRGLSNEAPQGAS